MNKPYIGITGFMCKDEVTQVLNVAPQKTGRMVMVGVLASTKTIRGIPNKRPNRYPAIENIPHIFIKHPLALNMVHFNTKAPEMLLSEMEYVMQLAGNNCHGFQLNVKWPDIKLIEIFRKHFPNIVIVLQCGSDALQSVKHDGKQLADKVSKYNGLINYVLIDPSGGYGIPLNNEQAKRLLHNLSERNVDMGLGVAGGLHHANLHVLQDIITTFPDISIDAEGKLRDAQDNLDMGLATQYLVNAFSLF